MGVGGGLVGGGAEVPGGRGWAAFLCCFAASVSSAKTRTLKRAAFAESGPKRQRMWVESRLSPAPPARPPLLLPPSRMRASSCPSLKAVRGGHHAKSRDPPTRADGAKTHRRTQHARTPSLHSFTSSGVHPVLLLLRVGTPSLLWRRRGGAGGERVGGKRRAFLFRHPKNNSTRCRDAPFHRGQGLQGGCRAGPPGGPGRRRGQGRGQGRHD